MYQNSWDKLFLIIFYFKILKFLKIFIIFMHFFDITLQFSSISNFFPDILQNKHDNKYSYIEID